jgi:hypothetical protein
LRDFGGEKSILSLNRSHVVLSKGNQSTAKCWSLLARGGGARKVYYYEISSWPDNGNSDANKMVSINSNPSKLIVEPIKRLKEKGIRIPPSLSLSKWEVQ